MEKINEINYNEIEMNEIRKKIVKICNYLIAKVNGEIKECNGHQYMRPTAYTDELEYLIMKLEKLEKLK